ncbi:MAG: hypothetical protein KKF98_16885 [Bacteroidetes bacterium]|nr:hypothetical protein [Bacteroidota bacterium]
MAWQTVAEGASLGELKSTVGELKLPKGSKVRVVMDTWEAWAFDAPGAELVFRPFVPDGLNLVDVWGESGKGIVEMEADPAWLLAILAFIKAHWLAIIIAGFVLTVIVSFIRIMVEVVAAPTPIPAALIIIGVVLLAMMVMRKPDT